MALLPSLPSVTLTPAGQCSFTSLHQPPPLLHHCPRSGSSPSLKLYPILLTANDSLVSLCDVIEYLPICVFLQFDLELKPSVSAGSRSISGKAQPSRDQVWLWP